MPKAGLKTKDVDKNHWSANKKPVKPTQTQVIVRILEGKNLLASDLDTGKSDPQCFVWLYKDGDEEPDLELAASLANNAPLPDTYEPKYNTGLSAKAQPNLTKIDEEGGVDDGDDGGDNTAKEDKENEARGGRSGGGENNGEETLNEKGKGDRDNDQDFLPEIKGIGTDNARNVLLSKVCYATCDPIWNDDLTFPIELDDLQTFLSLKICIVVRDEDDVDPPGAHSYDDLGRVDIPIATVLSQGRILKNSVCDIGRRYDLQKTSSMRRVDGFLKVTITVTFADDAKCLFPYLGNGIQSVEKFTEMLCKVQKAGGLGINSPVLQSLMGAQSVSQASAASIRASKTSLITPRIAPPVSARRPSSAPLSSTAPASITPLNFIRNPDGTLQGIRAKSPPKGDPGYDWEGDGMPSFKDADGMYWTKEGTGVVDVTGKISKIMENLQKANATLNETEADEFGFAPGGGDESAPPPDDAAGTNVEQGGKINPPESSHPPPSGNATNAARALKEMQNHRTLLQAGLQELLSVTKNGFESLSTRIGKLEEQGGVSQTRGTGKVAAAGVKKSSSSTDDSVSNSLLDNGPGGGDEGALPGEGDGESGIEATGNNSSNNTITKDANEKDSKKKTRKGSKFAALRKQMIEQRKQQMEEAGFIGDPAEFEALSGVEIVHKSSDGSITVSKADDPAIAEGLPTPVVNSNNDSNNYISMPPPRGGKPSSNPSTAFGGRGRSMASKGGDVAPPLTGSPVRAFRGVDWGMVECVASRGDHVTAFVEVLDRGSLQDILKLMEITGPKPETLSVGVRNRVLDSIATLLQQHGGGGPNAGANIERCLVWLLALIRSKDNLVSCIVPHTKRDLSDALRVTALETSKRGMLASLLATQLEKT